MHPPSAHPGRCGVFLRSCRWLVVSASLLGALVTLHAGLLGEKPAWSVDFAGQAIGCPIPLGPVEAARGVVITDRTGKITILDREGQKKVVMTMDLPAETPAVAVDLGGRGTWTILGVDAWGSVYAFQETGQRLWKAERRAKSGEFRLPVAADLDGDGRKEVLVSDSRGHLDVFEPDGRLRLQMEATTYRVSVPAVGDVDGDGRPEIVFGTEAGEVYCVDGRGEVVWFQDRSGCFGRAFPLLADPDGDGRCEVLVPTSFTHPQPGLYALDGVSGASRWKARSTLQTYRSTVVADLDGDGRREMLFGDKSSTVFCLDGQGQERWRTTLPGRGIFFAPSVISPAGTGGAVAFVPVRGSGHTGKSVYAVDAAGQVLEAWAMPGGGGAPLLACRFAQSPSLSLVWLTGAGRVETWDMPGTGPVSRVLWPGLRNDASYSGAVAGLSTARPTHARKPLVKEETAPPAQAVGGRNQLPPVLAAEGDGLVTVRTACPDGSLHLRFLRPGLVPAERAAGFEVSAPGRYDVRMAWYEPGQPGAVRRWHQVFHYGQKRDDDEREANEIGAQLRAAEKDDPVHARLYALFQQQAREGLTRARRSRAPGDFAKWRAALEQARASLAYLATHPTTNHVLVRQLTDPWVPFDGAAALRELVASVPAIEVPILGNAYESAEILLANLREEPVRYHLTMEPFQQGTNTCAASSVVTWHDVVSVRPDGVGKPVEDALPRLGEDQSVVLGAGEMRPLWLTVHSHGLTPGVWLSRLVVSEVSERRVQVEVPFQVSVSPVRLPERFTYRECNWLYLASIADPAVREATAQDALAHGMNVFVIPGVSMQVDAQGQRVSVDAAAHDALVRRLRGGVFFLVSGPVGVQWPAGVTPTPELEERAFRGGLRWYGDHMRELGVDYGDFAIYLQDEPGLLGGDEGFRQWVNQVKRFKAADARVQLYANPAGGARAALLREVADLVDVWAPDLHLVREEPAALPELFKKGKHYWHYEAPGDQRTLDPLGFYRVKPWVAFEQGMTGGGYWVYSDVKLEPAGPGGGSEYGSVYLTPQGPVTTRRWEATRAGIQDFELLTLVRATAQRVGGEAGQKAERLLNEAVRFVTQGQEKVHDISRHVRPYTPDHARWQAFREQLVETQRGLQEMR